MSDIEKIAKISITDMLLNEQLENFAINAWNKSNGISNKPYVKANLRDLISRNDYLEDEDPTIQVPLPSLSNPHSVLYEVPIDNQDKIIREDLSKKISSYETKISQIRKHIQLLGTKKMLIIQKIYDYIKKNLDTTDLRKTRDELQLQIRESDNDIAKLEQIIKDDKNQASEFINKKNITNYKNVLNQNNANKFNYIDQNPTETNNEYLTRLHNAAIAPNVDRTEINHLNDIRKLKDQLKEITRKGSTIEYLVKSFDDDKMIGNIKNSFPRIKKKLQELFGENTFKMSEDQLYDYITNIYRGDVLPQITTKQQNTHSNSSSNPSSSSHYSNSSSSSSSSSNNPYKIGSYMKPFYHDDKLVCYFGFHGNSKLYQLPNGEEMNIYASPSTLNASNAINKILWSKIFKDHPDAFPNTLTEKYNQFAFNEFINSLSNSSSSSSSSSNLITSPTTKFNNYNNKKWSDNIFGLTTPKEDYSDDDNYKTPTGSGLISHENIPRSILFGSSVIMPHRLYYDNTLVVKDQKGNSIRGFKNCCVSDAFVDVIMNMLKNKEPSHKELQMLKPAERQLFDVLIQSSDLGKKVVTNTKETTISELKKRLEIIEGEIEAGNTNNDIKNNLSDVLFKLVNLGSLTMSQATKHWNSMLDTYFYKSKK